VVGRAGRRPWLGDEQVGEVEAALTKGPKENGFPTDMWTLARVAEVIERVSGVRYSQTQTWAILREPMGWSRRPRTSPPPAGDAPATRRDPEVSRRAWPFGPLFRPPTGGTFSGTSRLCYATTQSTRNDSLNY
jgi:transposase